MCKYDVRIMSPVAMNIALTSVEYFFDHRRHSLKILCKFKHFPGRRKREWVFFSLNMDGVVEVLVVVVVHGVWTKKASFFLLS